MAYINGKEILFSPTITSTGDFGMLRRVVSGETVDLVIPEGTPKLRAYAFYYHHGIKSVTIPDSVTDIQYAVFSNCAYLERVTVGSGVKTMNGEVFYKCSACLIYDFSRCTSVPSLGAGCFGMINDNAKIIVPAHLYNEWIAETNWAVWKDYITTP